MKEILVCWVAICVISCNLNYVEAEQNGLQRITLAIAKGKEILDRGVKIQSERQDSVDFFGTKVDTSYATKQGFGDAVQEGSTDSFEDDLVRKKRTIDVLDYLRSQGLFTNSASGTNVNIVKINSVSNVNNYGPTPEATTAASRRRRSLKYVAADETVSIMTSDDEMKPDGSFKGRSMGEVHEAHVKKMMLGLGKGDLKKSANKRMTPVLYKSWDEKVSGYLSESRMKPNGSLKTHTISQSDDMSNRGVVVGAKSADELDEEVPTRYERSLGEARLKRSPQDIDEDATTEKPRCGGRGRAGPGEGGRGGRSGGGGGRRRSGGRGRGSTPSPDDVDVEDTDDQRMKREIKRSSQNDIQDYRESSNSVRSSSNSDSQIVVQSTSDSGSNGSDSGSDSDESNSESDSGSDSDSDSDSNSDGSDSESNSSETKDSEPNSASEVSDESSTPVSPVRSKRSPCWGRRQQQVTTTVAPAMMRRAKRDVPSPSEELDEEQVKVQSWFSTVVETIVESAKRVSAAVRRVFGRDEQGGEGNPDAEIYEGTSNPNAETLE